MCFLLFCVFCSSTVPVSIHFYLKKKKKVQYANLLLWSTEESHCLEQNKAMKMTKYILFWRFLGELPQNVQIKNKWKTNAVRYPNFFSDFVWETTDMPWQTVRRILKEGPAFRSQITHLLLSRQSLNPASILRREAPCIVLLEPCNVITIEVKTARQRAWNSSLQWAYINRLWFFPPWCSCHFSKIFLRFFIHFPDPLSRWAHSLTQAL